MGENRLFEAYKRAPHPIQGHGKRNLDVLKTALDKLDGDIESDIYGSGKIIEDFQQKMADDLGKERAVFFPSGTMAQQIALRIWCDQKEVPKVAYHPLCHLEIHEEDGLKKLHRIEPVLLADKDRVIDLDDVTGLKEEIACLLLELPQREIGGQLPEYETLVAISQYCREKGISVHLDGARLYEVLPYYGKSAAEICELFDSVYISFYKGFGGIAGAILAGDEAFTDESKVWKRRHGGDLISLYPYILSADHYFDQRVDKMDQYYEGAKELAAYLNGCEGIRTLPETPVSNMFHVFFHYPHKQIEATLIEVYEETGIGLTGYVKEVSENECAFEASIGDQYENVSKEQLRTMFHLMNQKLKQLKK
ncbi:low specificity L-threonine aldolase [Bacillus sp. AFS015802]|uniref:threonine aldolase family protein n=1 Tax=Bacillus sp. AFS015802 TaxID=2033486 RepID=UPI000BFA5C9C|nr:beta-eliminating lyase-related protein [Bacillus sp. AFS015802]PFA63269.1 low specificity L-threonine aldolase [Bacillus sp. AFS015802]